MAPHPERIEKLVERSSFGDPDARRARARVTDATAHALLHRVKPAAGKPTTRTLRSSSRSATLGQFRRPRGTSTS